MRNVAMGLSLWLLAGTGVVEAKAKFMGFVELSLRADLIAVIHVTRSQRIKWTKPFKGHWRYRQKNAFTLERVLKRAPGLKASKGSRHILWAEKGFICARASYRRGRYVVFLSRAKPGQWLTLNHHRGQFKIDARGKLKMGSLFAKQPRQTVASLQRMLRRKLSWPGTRSLKVKLQAAPPWIFPTPSRTALRLFALLPTPKGWPAGWYTYIPIYIPKKASWWKARKKQLKAGATVRLKLALVRGTLWVKKVGS